MVAGRWTGWQRPDPSPSPSCQASFPVCKMGWFVDAASPGVPRASPPPPTVSPVLRTTSSYCQHLGEQDGEGRTDRHRKQEGGCWPPTPHPRVCLQGDEDGRLPQTRAQRAGRMEAWRLGPQTPTGRTPVPDGPQETALDGGERPCGQNISGPRPWGGEGREGSGGRGGRRRLREGPEPGSREGTDGGKTTGLRAPGESWQRQPQDQTSQEPKREDPAVTCDLMTPTPPTSSGAQLAPWGVGSGLRVHLSFRGKGLGPRAPLAAGTQQRNTGGDSRAAARPPGSPEPGSARGRPGQ